MKPSQKRFLMSGLLLSAFLIGCVHLGRRSSLVSQTNIPKGRVRGSARAPVALIEFSDFQCPSCRRAQETVHDLLKAYPEDLMIVFKHYPLEMHPWAKLAAKAAQCAEEQGKFWPYHDRLFADQETWAKSSNAREDFEKMAKDLELNTGRFAACLDHPDTEKPIKADMAEGDSRQVSSTPSFFLGEFRLVGGAQLKRDGARLIELLRNEKRR